MVKMIETEDDEQGRQRGAALSCCFLGSRSVILLGTKDHSGESGIAGPARWLNLRSKGFGLGHMESGARLRSTDLDLDS